MARRAKPLQPKLRLRDRRRRMMWTKFAFSIAIFIVFVGGVVYVSHLSNFLITEVALAGAKDVDEEALKNTVKEKISGSYGFLIPRANAFFIPRKDIAQAVTDSFPIVGKASVSQKDPHTLLITITEREPSALWCSGSACYRMDSEGFVFEKERGNETLLRYRGAISGEAIGQAFPGFVPLHTLVAEAGSAIHRTPDVVTVAENGDVEVTLKEGGMLKFVISADATATLDNIASVFASQSFKSGREFEYADFRYGNKVYVKFKGD